MPVLQYRGGSSGAASAFGSPNFLSMHGDKGHVSWSLVLVILSLFTITSLLLSPRTVQPRASYAAYGLSFVLTIGLLAKLLCYCLKRRSARDPLIDAERQPSNRLDGIYSTDSLPVRPVFIGSQFSLNLSEYSVPPKYEYPPSYSQCVSTITLNKCS